MQLAVRRCPYTYSLWLHMYVCHVCLKFNASSGDMCACWPHSHLPPSFSSLEIWKVHILRCMTKSAATRNLAVTELYCTSVSKVATYIWYDPILQLNQSILWMDSLPPSRSLVVMVRRSQYSTFHMTYKGYHGNWSSQKSRNENHEYMVWLAIVAIVTWKHLWRWCLGLASYHCYISWSRVLRVAMAIYIS